MHVRMYMYMYMYICNVRIWISNVIPYFSSYAVFKKNKGKEIMIWGGWEWECCFSNLQYWTYRKWWMEWVRTHRNGMTTSTRWPCHSTSGELYTYLHVHVLIYIRTYVHEIMSIIQMLRSLYAQLNYSLYANRKNYRTYEYLDQQVAWVCSVQLYCISVHNSQ